jgi:uncharacterized repeat protein (TIGR01451 family)
MSMRKRSWRPIWVAAPAVAATAVFGISELAAQDSRGARPPVPDTRAATGMFGPPPAQVVVTSQVKPANEPVNSVKPVSLFFPDASPPPSAKPDTRAAGNQFGAPPVSVPVIPPVPANVPPAPIASNATPNLPPPKIIDASLPVVKPVENQSTPSVPVIDLKPVDTAPKPLPTFSAPPAAQTPSIPSTNVPTGPQPLMPAAPALLPSMGASAPSTTHIAQHLPFPTMQMLAKQSPAVTVEVQMPESVSVGTNLDYMLVVKNTGSTAVAHIKVDDEVPANTKYIASEPPAEMIGERLTWSVGTLEPGMAKLIKVSVKPADEGEVRSRAMVSFTTAAEAKVKVTRPRVSLGLTGMENVRVGEEVPFTIRVSNTGTGPATHIMVKARLTDGLHHPAGTMIEAAIDKLPAGESKTITLRALATKAGSHNCSIAAMGDGLTVEGTQSVVNIVEPMLTAKVAGPAKCVVRSEPEFKIDVANPGSASTDPVTVWCVIPDGFDFASCSDSGTYSASNRTIQWNLPPLNASAARQVSVKLKASAASAGSVKVMAQAAPPSTDGVMMASGKSTVGRVLESKTELPVKAEGVPALRFEVIDVEDPVEVGKEAIYEIKVTNTGTGPCTNVAVSAALAEGTSAAGAAGPTTARGQGSQVMFDPLPSLAPKGETTFRIKVKGTQAGDMKLRVQISCDEIKAPTIKEENTRFIGN